MRTLISTVGVVLLVASAAFAQTDRGTITGAVLDPTGAVVSGASVVVKNTETAGVFTASSTNTGNYTLASLPAGTYELIGPKVNGDPEHYGIHALILHAFAERLGDAPRDFDGLAAWLHAHPYEGIVWHHPDGRMAKIKKRDFPAPSL